MCERDVARYGVATLAGFISRFLMRKSSTQTGLFPEKILILREPANSFRPTSRRASLASCGSLLPYLCFAMRDMTLIKCDARTHSTLTTVSLVFFSFSFSFFSSFFFAFSFAFAFSFLMTRDLARFCRLSISLSLLLFLFLFLSRPLLHVLSLFLSCV